MVIASAFVELRCSWDSFSRYKLKFLIIKHRVIAQTIKLIRAARSYSRNKKIDMGSITGIYNLELDLYNYCSNRGLG